MKLSNEINCFVSTMKIFVSTTRLTTSTKLSRNGRTESKVSFGVTYENLKIAILTHTIREIQSIRPFHNLRVQQAELPRLRLFELSDGRSVLLHNATPIVLLQISC